MTSPPTYSCPMSRQRVIDAYFMEHRAKLLDIAAFLDRLDRAAPESDADAAADPDATPADATPVDDFRIQQLKEGVAVLLDGQGARTQRILELMSDPTMEPLASAAGLKGAHGAYPGK